MMGNRRLRVTRL